MATVTETKDQASRSSWSAFAWGYQVRPGYETGGALEGFGEPGPLRTDDVGPAPKAAGVHVVWGPEEELIYVGYTGNLRQRLGQHLSGNRGGSILRSKIGAQLDEDLGRTATADDITAFLNGCTVAWKTDPSPKRLKGRIMDELKPTLNELYPTLEDPEEGPEETEDPWEEFLFWIRRFHEGPDLDAKERDYKVRSAERAGAARELILKGDEGWYPTVKEALQKNESLTTWRANATFLEWCQGEPEAAAAALRGLWSSDDIVEHGIQAFAERLPSTVLSGTGTRLSIASFLAMGEDPYTYPIFRSETYSRAMQLTGTPTPQPEWTESRLYRHGLDFLDQIIQRAADKGIGLRDRLDAQALMWSVLQADLPEPTTPEELRALRRYRGAAPNVWWANQGGTYDAEREGGYVWAPQKTRSGSVLSHHLNVSKLREGDVIVHYAKGSIRALGRATTKAKKANRPSALPSESWQEDGYIARVDYFDLEDPVELAEIDVRLRERENPTFNKHGGVNQGYLYPLSDDFVLELREAFQSRWPAAAPWRRDTGQYWLFQANPKVWDLQAAAKQWAPGSASDWSATRFRDEMRIGDLIALWQAGEDAGLYAFAEISGDPFLRDEGERIGPDGEGAEWAVPIKIRRVLPKPLLKRTLADHPILSGLSVIRGPQGSNFRVTQEQWAAIQELLDEGNGGPDVPIRSFEEIEEYVRSKGMRLARQTLRRFHNSLRTRGFVILSGVSGAGKTWLAELYAEATGAEFLLVPVAPNWTSNEDLIGFFNPITKAYHHTTFTAFLRRAANEHEAAMKGGREPRKFLLLLDEMNLARVEQYFAKFLSKMEVRSRHGVADIELTADELVRLTPNLLFVGTVNVDETTHGFADKVYDRAQLIELEVPRDALADHLGSAAYRRLLLEVWDAVAPVAPFAFRVLNDIREYIDEAGDAGVSWEEALDEQILQKVLPKLSGSDLRIQSALEQLIEVVGTDYPLTQAKADRMLSDFTQHGFTSYF